jgi:hypothetical protein
MILFPFVLWIPGSMSSHLCLHLAQVHHILILNNWIMYAVCVTTILAVGQRDLAVKITLLAINVFNKKIYVPQNPCAIVPNVREPSHADRIYMFSVAFSVHAHPRPPVHSDEWALFNSIFTFASSSPISFHPTGSPASSRTTPATTLKSIGRFAGL